MFGGRKKRRQAIWDRVAHELGGVHHKQSRWWRADESITATLAGVDVKLDIYIVSTGKSAQAFTRVSATYAHGPGPKMKVYAQGFFSSIGKALGMRDVPLGDAAFDEAFIVRADQPAVARRLWSPAARAHMIDPLAKMQVTSDATGLRVTSPGRWEDPRTIHAAFAMIGDLASRDIYGELSLRALGSVEYSGRPYVELDTGVHVVVQAIERDDHLVMIARAAEEIAAEPMQLEVIDGRFTDDRASKLPQAAHVHVRGVGTGTLNIDGGAPGRVTMFVWRDLELDPARLRAGAELVGSLGAARGVYR